MHCSKAFLTLLVLSFSLPAAELSGTSALEFTGKAVSFGPRPPGSAANRRLQAYIRSQLKLRACEVLEDRFTAQTPVGPIRMNNIIARFAGTSGRAVVFSGHYDTKLMPEIHFEGANDAGSSTGLLLELARVLAGKKRTHDVYLVWFDGEESLREWSDTDGIHGSRHVARRWAADGTLKRIIALINVDMIGDKDLGILKEYYSDSSLLARVWKAAGDLGFGRYFLAAGGGVIDDHVPFVRLGVPAVNLIDFHYGTDNGYWHTTEDTMDKLSAHSLEVVGNVLLEVLRRLESESDQQ